MNKLNVFNNVKCTCVSSFFSDISRYYLRLVREFLENRPKQPYTNTNKVFFHTLLKYKYSIVHCGYEYSSTSEILKINRLIQRLLCHESAATDRIYQVVAIEY